MAPLNVRDLLLAQRLDRQQVSALLTPYGIKNPIKADANIQAMAGDPSERQSLAEILGELLQAVSQSADPDQALTYLERFTRAAIQKAALFTHLKEAPRSIEILAKTLGGSAYMAEILIRDPHHFYWLADPDVLYQRRKKRSIERELVQTLKFVHDERQRLDYLRALKRREMLHIGVRDLLRLCPVVDTLSALTSLAEVLINAAYWIASSTLRRQHAIPATAFTGFTILAMGKLGGGELNFSSDVDLMYLYASDEEKAGELSASEYFTRLCQRITPALNEFTSEGYVYRVDLRLRPEGKSGNLAYSLDGYKRYYDTRGQAWERLALLKARPVAGNRALGHAFLAMARDVIYARPFDVSALEEVREMKKKTQQKMIIRNEHSRNVKLGTGGIREIELIAQSLQIRHGAGIVRPHERNTLNALRTLCEESLISVDQCGTLTEAYIFLRDVENKLQMVNDAQTHSIPRDPEELAACARLLGYSEADRFMDDYQRHTSGVNSIFDSLILTGH